MEELENCTEIANLSFSFGQSAGMNLAQWGALPNLIVYVLLGIIFVALVIIILLDKTISYLRLVVYSVVVWAVLVVGLYALFILNIHHRASDQVSV